MSFAGAREFLRESPSEAHRETSSGAERWTGACSYKPEPAATLATTRRQQRDPGSAGRLLIVPSRSPGVADEMVGLPRKQHSASE